MGSKRTTVPPLYRFFNASGAIETLKTRKLRWKSPLYFNDPFDGCLDPLWNAKTPEFVNELTTRLLPYLLGEQPLKDLLPKRREEVLEIQKMRQDIVELPKPVARAWLHETLTRIADGQEPKHVAVVRKQAMGFRVLCLSDAPDNLLLWSHYAGGHTGAAMRLDVDHMARMLGAQLTRMIYRDAIPTVFSVKELAAIRLFETNVDKNAIAQIFRYKAKCWEYEKEFRLLRDGQPLNSSYSHFGFDRATIREIILGCRMSDSDEARIRDLAASCNPKILVKKARIRPQAFAIDI